ncbi:MAG: homocysteine S-methyltransferase family protein [Actinobacteria bacterium]|nr:homocysteine S-methyltransferase family protein [Actinomycetota bacterium]
MGTDLGDRLAAGEVIVLDGAMGTELQRRGVPMGPAAWCAAANLTHPHVVEEIHRDHLAAGARIVTTNTFPGARHVLAAAGMGDDVAAVNRTAVALARHAVEDAGVEWALVAGSLSSMAPLEEWHAPPVGRAVAEAYREQAHLLAEAGADVLVAEMMLDLENAALVIGAALETGLPVLVGWSASPGADGAVTTFRSGLIDRPGRHSFDEVLREGVRLGGEVHGIMHSEIGVTGPALDLLSRHWDGPTLAYAEMGRFDPPHWVFSDEATPASYASTASTWVDRGVQVIGGCCGTLPEHIRALAAAVAGP